MNATNLEFIINTDQKEIELKNISLPITVERFFDLFICEEALYSFKDVYTDHGDEDIVISKWEFNPEHNFYNRDLSYVVKVSGVPFMSKAKFV